MKALIICNDFPPLNSIGAQRPYSWFRYFHINNIETVVITKNWSGRSSTKQDVLSASADDQTKVETSEMGTIIKVPIRQNYADKILLKYGDNKFILLRKILSFVYKAFAFFSFRLDKHCDLYFEAREYLKNNKIDYLITTGEPFILFRYGFLLRKKFHFQWIADYRDGWYLNHTTNFKKDFLNRLLQLYELFYEKKFIRRADIVQTVDPKLAGQLSTMHHKPVKVVYNGFDEFYQCNEEKRLSPQLILSHTGTLTPGQRVEFLLKAVKELHDEGLIKPSDLKINFIGLGYDKDQCARVLNYDKGVFDYIHITERISREEALSLNASSDFLLNFTQEGYSVIYAKTYDYFSVKKPILVLPGDNGLLSDIVVNNNAGYVFDQVEKFKIFLVEKVNLARNFNKNDILAINVQSLSFYTRKAQTEAFCNYLKRKRKALILAYDYYPLNTIGAQRPYSWFRYFNEFDIKPVIVTRYWYENRSLKDNYFKKTTTDKTLREISTEGEVIKVRYTPNIRDKIVYKYGLSKFILLRRIFTLFYDITQFLTLAFDNKSAIYKEAKKELKNDFYDYIIATGEPFILFRYAFKLSRKSHVPWIADYRDGWTTNYNTLFNIGSFNSFLMQKYYLLFEKKYMEESCFITTTANSIKNDLLKLHPGSNVKIVFNGYFEELFNDIKDIPQSDNVMEISYAGTIYPYQRMDIFLDGFTAFLNKFPEAKVKVNLYGVDYKSTESKWIIRYNDKVTPFLNFVEHTAQKEFINRLKSTNILLLLANENYKQVYAKIFEYLALNRKIMLVTNDRGDMEKILNETNSAYICNDVMDVENCLEKLYLEFLKEGEIKNNTENSKIYSRRNQAKKFASYLKELS